MEDDKVISIYSQLPTDVQCEIVRSSSLTLEDVKNISLVSTKFRDVLRRCLTYLHLPAAETEYKGEAIDPALVTPGFISLFPNLVEVDYPIVISSFQQLRDVAKHESLKRVTLDLSKIHADLLADWKKRGEKYGIDVMTIRNGNPVYYNYGSISEGIYFFISEYLYSHAKVKTALNNIKFTFLLPYATLVYTTIPSPTSNQLVASLCYLSTLYHGIEEEDMLFNWPRFTPVLDEILPIKRYVGNWPILDADLEEIIVTINKQSDLVDFDSDLLGYTLHIELFYDIFNDYPNLVTFGYQLSTEDYLAENILFATGNGTILEYLYAEGYTSDKLRRYDVPITIEELPFLRHVFPNVKEPLLDPFTIVSTEENGILSANEFAFDAFRLLPGYIYPDDFTTTPTYVDYSNYYTRLPC